MTEEAGFEVPENTIDLRFTDPSFNGLRVTMLIIPFNQLSDTAKLGDIDPNNLTDADLKRWDNLINKFADSVVSWNLKRKGKKVPTTRTSVGSLDPIFLMQLVDAWIQGLGRLLVDQASEDAETAKSLQVQLANTE